jgi:RNA polymerase sporulation-specific sigma factor
MGDDMETVDWKTLQDEELAAIASEPGDQAAAAANQLMERYKDMVRSKARAYFLMGADSEDVIQEGMIGLYKAIMDYNADKKVSFHAFAELCVVRQIQSAVKQAARKKQMPLNSYVSLDRTVTDEEDKTVAMIDIFPADSSYNPERFYLEKEKIKTLMDKINGGLSAMENQVLKLYLSGLDYHEIARRLEKPTKSIDNALQRIKKKIGGLIQDLSS